MENFDAFWKIVCQLKPVKGVLLLDILDMPDPLGNVFRQIIRAGPVSLDEFAAKLGVEAECARQIGEVLVEKGYLSAGEYAADGQVTYQVYIARMRKRNIPLDL